MSALGAYLLAAGATLLACLGYLLGRRVRVVTDGGRDVTYWVYGALGALGLVAVYWGVGDLVTPR